MMVLLLTVTLVGDIVICSHAAPSLFRGILGCDLLDISDFLLVACTVAVSYSAFFTTPRKS